MLLVCRGSSCWRLGLPLLILLAYTNYPSITRFYFDSMAVAAEEAPVEKLDRFAPLRDYSGENRKLDFSKKKKAEADSAGAVEQEKSEEPVKKIKSISSGSTVAALVITAIGIGIILWVGLLVVKKFFPGGKSLFSTPAMEILGRTQFDQQKYIALVRVGKRVLVVGVSQGGFDSITEIADEVEAADIMALSKPKTSTGKDLFHKMFQRQVAGVELSSISPAGAEVTDLQGDGREVSAIEKIQARVRSLRETE